MIALLKHACLESFMLEGFVFKKLFECMELALSLRYPIFHFSVCGYYSFHVYTRLFGYSMYAYIVTICFFQKKLKLF